MSVLERASARASAGPVALASVLSAFSVLPLSGAAAAPAPTAASRLGEAAGDGDACLATGAPAVGVALGFAPAAPLSEALGVGREVAAARLVAVGGTRAGGTEVAGTRVGGTRVGCTLVGSGRGVARGVGWTAASGIASSSCGGAGSARASRSGSADGGSGGDSA